MTNSTPKSKQLYFFLMPEEMFEVLEFIEQIGGVIYSSRSSNPKPCKYQREKDIGQIFISPVGFEKDVDMKNVGDGIYVINLMVSPVIELQCSILRDTELSRGRIYFRGGYIDQFGWISFDKNLYELFNCVEKFIKKFFATKERKYGALISKSTQLYIANNGNLAQF
jgi:hypothetical protein